MDNPRDKIKITKGALDKSVLYGELCRDYRGNFKEVYLLAFNDETLGGDRFTINDVLLIPQNVTSFRIGQSPEDYNHLFDILKKFPKSKKLIGCIHTHPGGCGVNPSETDNENMVNILGFASEQNKNLEFKYESVFYPSADGLEDISVVIKKNEEVFREYNLGTILKVFKIYVETHDAIEIESDKLETDAVKENTKKDSPADALNRFQKDQLPRTDESSKSNDCLPPYFVPGVYFKRINEHVKNIEEILSPYSKHLIALGYELPDFKLREKRNKWFPDVMRLMENEVINKIYSKELPLAKLSLSDKQISKLYKEFDELENIVNGFMNYKDFITTFAKRVEQLEQLKNTNSLNCNLINALGGEYSGPNKFETGFMVDAIGSFAYSIIINEDSSKAGYVYESKRCIAYTPERVISLPHRKVNIESILVGKDITFNEFEMRKEIRDRVSVEEIIHDSFDRNNYGLKKRSKNVKNFF